jgi:hypothetical protein
LRIYLFLSPNGKDHTSFSLSGRSHLEGVKLGP